MATVECRARFYDHVTGSFLTKGRLNATTRSACGYVYGNPLRGTDPSWLYWLTGVYKEASGGEGHEVCKSPIRVGAVRALLEQTAPATPTMAPANSSRSTTPMPQRQM